MGWLSGTGALSRIVGPLYATVVYVNFGVRWVAVGTSGIIILTLFILGVAWRRLVPYDNRVVGVHTSPQRTEEVDT